MGRILFALFLVVPLIEIALFIVMGQIIGLWPTLLGVVVTAMIGSIVIRKQGLNLLAEIQRLTQAGILPAKQVVEGIMLAVAGALLLTPGYFTDLCGFLLLVPPLRGAIYTHLKTRIDVRKFAPGVDATDPTGNSTGEPGAQDRQTGQNPDVIDLNSDHWRGH